MQAGGYRVYRATFDGDAATVGGIQGYVSLMHAYGYLYIEVLVDVEEFSDEADINIIKFLKN